MQGWERKSVLRKTVGMQLPQELLKAPKHGFGVPLREWFRGDDNSNLLKFGNIKDLLNADTLQMIIAENNSRIRDNGNFIWTVMMLDKMIEEK